MAIIDLQDKIVEIVERGNDDEFIYEFLTVYDIPRATITRLKSGSQNLSKRHDEVHLKNKVWYRHISKTNLFDSFIAIENQIAELSAKPRFILVTDFIDILAKDTRTNETLDIKFIDLPKHFDFFLAWKGIEKIDFMKENPADIKAAERFARLYDVLQKENEISNNVRGLDVFLIRILFCLFAEDTEIFENNSFTNLIKTLTEEDGSDLNKCFEDLFAVLDKIDRENVPSYLQKFPYVNGQLFTEKHVELNFSFKSRKLIIECGELLDWSQINPDIFGSMVQTMATDDNRSHLGMHYTSVPNIMKVIKPLFLDDLYEAFEKAYDSMEKLTKLYDRIGKIKFFDPACGSGNFLIITYKELRRFEIRILLRQRELAPTIWYLPSVTLDQFYGIEIDDFAHNVAKLSLWIAEHQMNIELERAFYDKVRPTLPLKSSGNIWCENAIRIAWLTVCPQKDAEEIYVFGNPPYLGSKKQTKEHKADMIAVFGNVENGKMLDYIAAWFYLAAKFSMKTNAKVAFVSTNSICQGEQVYTLWNELFKYNIQINFAYESFKWENNAKGNAGVTVIIVGFTTTNSKTKKYIFVNGAKKLVSNISPYLTDGDNILVSSRNSPLSELPKLCFGNMPNDGGGLIFTKEEYFEAINKHPELNPFFKKFIGSEEFINGGIRYCLWLDEKKYKEISLFPIIQDRILITKNHREKSTDQGTNKLAVTPWKFRDTHETKKVSIVVPAVSSENRFYIPMGIADSETILSNRVYVVYDAEIYILGILMSRMHMTWVKAVGGRLETRYNYSAGLCYNTFPIPELSINKKRAIEGQVLEILDIREEIGGTLAELYNPPMHNRLQEAHEKLDFIVDKIYKDIEFSSDDDRLGLLLSKYKKAIEEIH